MSEDLRCIVYVSAAVVPMDEAALQALLLDARWRNAASGLTGVLLHHDGNFMQCLEGTSEAVGAVYARIVRDRRHKSVYTLMDELVERRQFVNWTMGLATPPASQMLKLSTARWAKRSAVPLDPASAPSGLELLKDFWEASQR